MLILILKSTWSLDGKMFRRKSAINAFSENHSEHCGQHPGIIWKQKSNKHWTGSKFPRNNHELVYVWVWKIIRKSAPLLEPMEKYGETTR